CPSFRNGHVVRPVAAPWAPEPIVGIICLRLEFSLRPPGIPVGMPLSIVNSTAPAPAISTAAHGPWWRDLTRAHWFVFAMASMAWMFDCLDQQLFIIA